MKIYLLKKPVLIILLIQLGFITTYAQQLDSSSLCMLEMIKIKTLAADADNLSFDLKILSKQKDSTGQYVTDTIKGFYKINKNNYWGMLDSVELVQNSEYSVAIYGDDKLIFVQKPKAAYNNIVTNDFLNSSLMRNEADKLSLSNDSGNVRKLSIVFKPASQYLNFDVYYDNTTYKISKVIYKIKDGIDYIQVTYLFSNYQVNTIDPLLFDSRKYFTANGSQLVVTSTYSNYELVNGLNN